MNMSTAIDRLAKLQACDAVYNPEDQSRYSETSIRSMHTSVL